MSFERYRAQTLCEKLVGCTCFDEFYCSDFESLMLDKSKATELSNLLKEDACDLFYKGYLSLIESLNSYNNRYYSWAVVKGYYSCFYMIKADFALKDFGLIRHKTIYYLEAKEGAKPITKGKKGNNRKNYSGDHKSTLNYYKDLFVNSDIMLSQNIEGISSYEWLMKKREQINYQERYFNEPDKPMFLEYIDSQISSNSFTKLINEIINDKLFILTFQPEFAPLAIPIKRAILTNQSFIKNGVINNLTKNQVKHIKRFINYNLFSNY